MNSKFIYLKATKKVYTSRKFILLWTQFKKLNLRGDLLHLLNIIIIIIRNFYISFAYCIHCTDYVTYNKAIYI